MILGVGTISGLTFGAAIGVIAEADVEFYEIAMVCGGIAGTYLTNKILSPEHASLSLKDDKIKISLSPDMKFIQSSKPGFNSIVPGFNLNINF